MKPVYTVEQIRAAESAAISDTRDGELMQRASYGLAAVCLRLLAEWRGGAYGASVAVLAGTGGNGGDALYAGSFLARRGVAVTALLSDPSRSYPGAREAFEAAGGRCQPLTGHADVVAGADLVIDGLVGLASGRSLELPTAEAVALARHGGIVAVDLPSGVAVDSGAVADDALRAVATVTFGALKPAHVLAPAVEHCGAIELVDIGLGPYLPAPQIEALEDSDVAALWPRQPYSGHKYSTGVVGVAAGSERYPGAAVLCVGGAVRAKPGMVRYAGPAHAADLVISRWPEAVVARSMSDAGRTDAWVVGPGIGTDEHGSTIIDEAVGLDVPVLFDADALSRLAKRIDDLRSRPAATVLTPHAGEFARLFGEIADPVVDARRAAAGTGCVVLLKGPATIVASPDGHVLVNPTGTARLATAGTGDVLGGVIGALLAAGVRAPYAAAAGAFVHGAAAQAAPGPITASDLPDLIHAYLSES